MSTYELNLPLDTKQGYYVLNISQQGPNYTGQIEFISSGSNANQTVLNATNLSQIDNNTFLVKDKEGNDHILKLSYDKEGFIISAKYDNIPVPVKYDDKNSLIEIGSCIVSLK